MQKQIICRLLHHQKETLYDVLNVKRGCTSKEIRDSFLKLSKENHPDMKRTGNNPAETAKFIRMMEAYKVLSKKSSRDNYDLDLKVSEGISWKTTNVYGNQYSMRYGQYSRTDSSEGNGLYYGVKGLSKVSNLKIAAILLVFAALGTLMQFFIIRNSFTFQRELLDDFSKDAGMKHANVRADAEKYGNEKQLERLAEKLLQRNR